MSETSVTYRGAGTINNETCFFGSGGVSANVSRSREALLRDVLKRTRIYIGYKALGHRCPAHEELVAIKNQIEAHFKNIGKDV